MTTLTLDRDQQRVLDWAMHLHLEQSERLAAFHFTCLHNPLPCLSPPNEPYERAQMARELAEMRTCHELRAALNRGVSK